MAMSSIIDQLMDFLMHNQAEPMTYLLIFFLFSVAAAVFLPIPIEIGLIWNPGLFFPLKALDLGLGKGVGAVAVFYIGAKLDTAALRLSRWGPVSHIRLWLWMVVHRLGIDRWRLYCRFRARSCRRAEARQSPSPLVPEMPKWGWLSWLARKSEAFVRRYGVLAMYVIMSIPGMIDTVPLYVFAILNKEGTLITLRDFALANFLAGVNRAFLIFAILELFGIRLVG